MHKRKGIYRQYSEEEKTTALVVLEANKGDISTTSRQLDIPRGTLNRWKQHDGCHPVVLQKQQETRAAIADRLEEMSHALIDLIPEKATEGNVQQLSVSLAIAIDKMRLLREQATAITQKQTQETTDEHVLIRLRKLAERLNQRQPLLVDASGSPGTGGDPAGRSALPAPSPA